MIAPEEEVVIDVNTSCTKDEAVAKLLGWSKGPIFPRRIQVTEYGVERMDLGKLSTFGTGVQGQLERIHLSAQNRLVEAAEGDWTPEQLQSLEDEVYKCRELILRASDFFLAIDDELAKGELSELRIHHESTRAGGTTRITLGSIERWALAHHQVDIRSPHRQKPQDQIGNLQEPQSIAAPTEKGATKYSGLSITFACLIDAFLERAPSKFKRPDGSVNVKALADELSKLAQVANNGLVLKTQTAETIKTRIEEARKTRREALPSKAGF